MQLLWNLASHSVQVFTGVHHPKPRSGTAHIQQMSYSCQPMPQSALVGSSSLCLQAQAACRFNSEQTYCTDDMQYNLCMNNVWTTSPWKKARLSVRMMSKCIHVAAPCRNRTLFRCAFQCSKHCSITSVKGGDHMCCIDAWIPGTSTQRVGPRRHGSLTIYYIPTTRSTFITCAVIPGHVWMIPKKIPAIDNLRMIMVQQIATLTANKLLLNFH